MIVTQGSLCKYRDSTVSCRAHPLAAVVVSSTTVLRDWQRAFLGALVILLAILDGR